MKQRLDKRLLELGLFDTRARAQAAIRAGTVTIAGWRVRAPSERFERTAEIAAAPAHPYVSRGGIKLAAALDHFGIDPRGRLCLDVGASTGGFSDVLLARGAAHVVAVDTGRDQLHASLRVDPRLVSLESTDIRTVSPASLGEAPDLAVIDVSFISLTLVLPAVAALLTPRCEVVALIKPQFEVGRGGLGKGGVVRDEAARAAAIERVRACLSGLGFQELGTIDSPIPGGDGNREHVIAGRRHACG